MVSALLSFMAVSGFFGKRNLAKIDIDIEFPKEIFANKEFPLKIKLKNNRRFLPLFLIRIKIDQYEALFPFVDIKSYAVKYLDVSFRRRGKNEIKNLYIYSVFPFNFFIRFKRVKKAFEFTVFPEPKRCEYVSSFVAERLLKGEMPLDKIGFNPDILSIRQYIYGDPFKYINWKATAKTGELKTKEFASLAFQPIVIDFEKSTIREIEEKISCITYIIMQLLKKNIPVGLKIGNKFYKPDISRTHKISILKELALYESSSFDKN